MLENLEKNCSILVDTYVVYVCHRRTKKTTPKIQRVIRDCLCTALHHQTHPPANHPTKARPQHASAALTASLMAVANASNLQLIK